MDTEAEARKIAARVAGIREDQVDVAVTAYREALSSLYDEPEWRSVLFMMGICVAQAEGTEIQMEQTSATKKHPSSRIYVYERKPYQTFGEARAVELADKAKFSIRETA